MAEKKLLVKRLVIVEAETLK